MFLNGEFSNVSRDHFDRLPEGVPKTKVRPPAVTVDGDKQD
jgi:hypothetical protein